ncbi:hypothetical protein ABBQ32_001791 [Trebouxia sp. C0010 RCD-2024]
MAGTSKALEFPSDVVFQRVTDSREATSLLHLSAIAQHTELTVRLLCQHQQYSMPQAQLHLQSQLDDLLWQLLQLANTLHIFAEHNRGVSQQLQQTYGVTSKVAEKLMLAHCEQELAQRAKIVSETRATVQLPPFAEVMQQISDHVRQEFTAMDLLYAQPAQYGHPCVSPYVGHRCPVEVPSPYYQYPLCSGYGQSPVHPANPQLNPVCATGALQHSRAESCPANQADLAANRPLFMPSHNIYGQQQVSSHQMLTSSHSLPPAQQQVHAPLGPAVQHSHEQTQGVGFAPQITAAHGQPASHLPQGSFQHTSPGSGLHAHSPWQHTSPALRHSNSALLPHAALPAAASSPAPACCPDQPQSIMAPGHVAAVVASLDQGVGLARCASISEPYGLIPSQDQSALVADDHLQLQHAIPVAAALCTGTSASQVPLGKRACCAAPPSATSLAGQTQPQAVMAAMPLTQETPCHSVQHSYLPGQHCKPVSQQEHSSLPLPSGKQAPHSLPALELAAPGKICGTPPGVQPTGTSPTSRGAGFSSLLHAVEQGQPATISASAGNTHAGNTHAGNTHAARLTLHTCAAGSIAVQYPTAAGSTVVPSTQPLGSRLMSQPAPAHGAPPAVPGHSARLGDALLATPIYAQHLAATASPPEQVSLQLGQISQTCASISNRGAAASMPAAVGLNPCSAQQVASAQQEASEGSFRFQLQNDYVQGMSAGVCCTPVLRPRSQQVAHAGSCTPAVATAVDNAARGGGCSPQQEVVIPDSEESPGRCSQQRHAASPPRNGGAPEHPGDDMAGAAPLSLQHSTVKQSLGQHGSTDQAVSASSIGALPGHSRPEVWTQFVPAEQHAGHALGCGMSSPVASQQQTGPPRSLNLAAAACQYALHTTAQTMPTAAAIAAATAVAEASPASAAAANTAGQMMAQSATRSGLNPKARSGLEPSLPLPTPMLQHTDPSLPEFGEPIALAPAGPTEHLWVEQRALSRVKEPPRTSGDQQGFRGEPVGVQTRVVAGADQRPSRAQQLEGSQPSSSSLKRVPETPDSAENRSQPTQSSNGNQSSSRGAAPSGLLHVVLVNNSDEQAGTQGVNVAAFLLMDSQKDSTSPGHARTARFTQGVREGGVLPAASIAIGDSQTHQLPMFRPSQTNTCQTTRQAKASTKPAPHQHSISPVRSPDTGQQVLQAATNAMPGAEAARAAQLGAEPGMTPAQRGTPEMPAGITAPKQSAGKQKCPGWPGSCSQGPVADANRLHGIAAVAVPPRRSQSCSAGKRQHTAKKLIFQQLSLAQQANSSPGRAPATTAAHRDAVDVAKQQPVVAVKQTAAAVDGVLVPLAETHAKAADAGLAGKRPGRQAVAVRLAGSQGVSAARQDAKAAAALCQKEGPAASGPEQHGPAGSDGPCPHPEADKASSGSQEQWETVISKLRRLAQKHSQDSQENAAAMDTDMTPEAGDMLEHRPVHADEQPPAHNRHPASLRSHLLHVACRPSHVEKLQQQVAVPGRPAAVYPAVPGTAGQLQVPTDHPGIGAQALQGEPVPKPSTGNYTALSHAKGVMRQQKQQLLETDPLMDTGQKPGNSMIMTASQAPLQHSWQAPNVKPEQLEGRQAEPAQKRKRLEAVVKPDGLGEGAAHVPSAHLPCKKQRLSASGHQRSHSPAAQGCQSTERHSLVCSKRQTGAAKPSSPVASDQGEPHQRIRAATVLNTAPMLRQLVAWAPECEANSECVGVRHNFQQLPCALPVAVEGGQLPAASATVGVAVKALVKEAAAGPLMGEAMVLPPAGQQDKSQAGSEPQQGGLRLDLSSEEDPLLCTQKVPSSQGNSGSGQGLFKTPDDPVSEGQGASLAQVPPAGLANMQSPWMMRSSLALPSPWNTPALPQPPIPQPSEPASIRKPAGNDWMLQWCACHPLVCFPTLPAQFLP